MKAVDSHDYILGALDLLLTIMDYFTSADVAMETVLRTDYTVNSLIQFLNLSASPSSHSTSPLSVEVELSQFRLKLKSWIKFAYLCASIHNFMKEFNQYR